MYGARPLARVIQRDVRDRLTDELLFGKLEHGGTAAIDAKADGLTFDLIARAAPAQAATENA